MRSARLLIGAAVPIPGSTNCARRHPSELLFASDGMQESAAAFEVNARGRYFYDEGVLYLCILVFNKVLNKIPLTSLSTPSSGLIIPLCADFI